MIAWIAKASIKKHVVILVVDMAIVSMIMGSGPEYFSSLLAYNFLLIVWSITAFLSLGCILFFQYVPENDKKIVESMLKEILKKIRKARRDKTKKLDLRTRIATTEKSKKDPKVARRKWKQKQKGHNDE